MTIKELMKQLKKFDKHKEVIMSFDSGFGFTSIIEVEEGDQLRTKGTVVIVGC